MVSQNLHKFKLSCIFLVTTSQLNPGSVWLKVEVSSEIVEFHDTMNLVMMY